MRNHYNVSNRIECGEDILPYWSLRRPAMRKYYNVPNKIECGEIYRNY